MIKRVLNFGVTESMQRKLIQQIRLTNLVILLLISSSILMLFPIFFEDGLAIVIYIDILTFGLLIVLLKLNSLGFHLLTRVLVSIIPSIIVMVASIASKYADPANVSIFDFFDARVLGAGFCVLPFILFTYLERKIIFITIIIPLLLVVAFDPIHSMFGVGYISFFGKMPKQYIVLGIYIDIVLVFVASAIYKFLENIENLHGENTALIEDLESKNLELSALFLEQEKSTLLLEKNKGVIDSQKKQLQEKNEKLSEEVSGKSMELKQSNQELIKHNNDLQQFSNTLSHNLRGPVANLLGLSNLFTIDTSEESRKSIADHIHKSANALDIVIKDLNKIVELRNNLFQIKEKINIIDEINNIWLALDSNVKQCGAILNLDIQTGVTFGVRSYFHSILYNLISNALKYRSPERPCLINVSAKKFGGKCIISVEDNGLGVDLNKHGDKIFGMYKRFHTHLDGKGLGLFLTKQQIESMGGTIAIESTPNKGTKFTVRYQEVVLSAIESQLFYGSEVANIYLDVVNLITTLIWKRMPTPDEFKEVFTNNIEVFSSYNSDKWIIKLELLKEMPEREKQWILDNAIDTYASVGVKIIAVIRDLENSNQDFWDEFSSRTAKKSLEVLFVDSFDKAKEKLLLV